MLIEGGRADKRQWDFTYGVAAAKVVDSRCAVRVIDDSVQSQKEDNRGILAQCLPGAIDEQGL
jgi:hypothetical protein